MPFLVPADLDLDLQTHLSEGPNMSVRVNLAEIRSAFPKTTFHSSLHAVIIE